MDVWTWAAACWMGVDLEDAERWWQEREAAVAEEATAAEGDSGGGAEE